MHRLRITTYKSHRIKPLTNTRAIQLLRERPPANVSRFIEPIESYQRLGQVSGPDSRVWIQSLRLTRRSHGFFELTRDRIEVSEIARPTSFTRITAHIRFLRLNRLLQLTGHDLVVEIGDARAFIFANAVTQSERLRQTLGSKRGLARVGVLKRKS